MNKDILKRNTNIYYEYKNVGYSYESIASRYNLKVSTIKKIISERHKVLLQRDKFMKEIHEYLRHNLRHNVATTAFHGLQRYMNYNNIFYKEDLKKVIEQGTYIRNVGPKSRDLLRKYFELD